MGSNPVIPNKLKPQKAVDFEYDFRNIYASILKDWFLVPTSQIQSLFEHQVLLSCGNDNVPEEVKQELVAYPNPTITTTTLVFSSLKENVRVIIYDTTGRRLKEVFKKGVSEGEHKVVVDVSFLPKGEVYILNIVKVSGNLSVQLIVAKR